MLFLPYYFGMDPFYQWNEQLAMAGSMSNNPADNMYCMVSFFQNEITW